jgi:hypothetical protein
VLSLCHAAKVPLEVLPAINYVVIITCTTTSGSLTDGNYPVKLTATSKDNCGSGQRSISTEATGVQTLTSTASLVAVAASSNAAVCPGAASLTFTYSYSGTNALDSPVQLRATLLGATCVVSSAGRHLAD